MRTFSLFMIVLVMLSAPVLVIKGGLKGGDA